MEKRWKDGEEIFILRNWHEMSNRELAEYFEVKPSQIASKKRQLSLKYNNGKAPKEEEIYDVIDRCIEGQMAKKKKEMLVEEQNRSIIKNYKKMTNREIAEKIGLTWQTVYSRKEKLAEEGLIEEWAKREVGPKTPNKMGLKEKIPADIIAEQKELKRKIDTLDGNLELGRRYKIKEINYDKKKGQKRLTGELIQVTDKHYTFKNRYVESFLKMDFILGEYSIEEV